MPAWIQHSVRRKFALVVLAATLAALAMAGAAMIYYEQRNYHRTWVNDLSALGEILGRASAPALAFDDAKAAGENLGLLRARPQISAAAIYNARGKLFSAYQRDAGAERPLPGLPEADGSRIEGGDLVLFRRVVDRQEILGTIYLRADFDLTERLWDYGGILAVVLGLSLVLALLLSAWLLTALTKPILAVTEVAREVLERRDFSLRVRKTTQDEVGVLVDAFNDMLAEVGRRAEALEAMNRSLEQAMNERKRVDDELRSLNASLEKRVQERTSQLEEANKEMEAFSYSVSHDLRAPLRGVIGFADAVLEDHGADLSEEARRKIDIITDEARRMGMLIDDLLAFSRLGRKTLQRTEFDMRKLAGACVEDLRRQYNGQAFDVQLGALPAARGDRALIGQVWTNLISNAFKFSAKRSTPKVVVSAVTDVKEHIYFVRDNGAGFDPRYQSKLFGVFQRLHNSSDFPGTGVGLALVQRIIGRHGGRVWAEGVPDEGATFYFTLPRESADGTV